MPAVFVHGVPETHRIWDAIRSKLSRDDTIAVDLPGFSAPVPDGFGATKDEYAGWLTAEIEKLGEPVDLVGHDWGALLSLRVASTRPDLIRTWCVGGAAIHPDYTWHEFARMWQTPGVGEQFMQAMSGDTLKVQLVASGVPEDAAQVMGDHIDDTMKDCILELYRSAVEVGKEWSPALDNIPANGLLIWGRDDPYMQQTFAEKMSERIGARLISLPDTGHFWPAQRPTEAAAALEDHWAPA